MKNNILKGFLFIILLSLSPISVFGNEVQKERSYTTSIILPGQDLNLWNDTIIFWIEINNTTLFQEEQNDIIFDDIFIVKKEKNSDHSEAIYGYLNLSNEGKENYIRFNLNIADFPYVEYGKEVRRVLLEYYNRMGRTSFSKLIKKTELILVSEKREFNNLISHISSSYDIKIHKKQLVNNQERILKLEIIYNSMVSISNGFEEEGALNDLLNQIINN